MLRLCLIKKNVNVFKNKTINIKMSKVCETEGSAAKGVRRPYGAV